MTGRLRRDERRDEGGGMRDEEKSGRKQEQEAGKMNGSQSPCHLLLPSASSFSSLIPFLLRRWRVWRRRFVVASDYYGHLIRPEIFLYLRVGLFERAGVDDLRVVVNVVGG